MKIEEINQKYFTSGYGKISLYVFENDISFFSLWNHKNCPQTKTSPELWTVHYPAALVPSILEKEMGQEWCAGPDGYGTDLEQDGPPALVMDRTWLLMEKRPRRNYPPLS